MAYCSHFLVETTKYERFLLFILVLEKRDEFGKVSLFISPFCMNTKEIFLHIIFIQPSRIDSVSCVQAKYRTDSSCPRILFSINLTKSRSIGDFLQQTDMTFSSLKLKLVWNYNFVNSVLFQLAINIGKPCRNQIHLTLSFQLL
ncbi:hypothetical protein ML8HA_02706 [Lactococcus lactis]|nr:hypothetical protein [Lactococcus lactis]